MRSFQLLRYHHGSQFLWRLRRRFDFFYLARRSGAPFQHEESRLEPRQSSELNEIRRRRVLIRKHEGQEQRRIHLLQNRICLLSDEFSFAGPMDWRMAACPDVSHLCRFHLHYHEFLLDFLRGTQATKEEMNWAWSVVLDWIEAHPFPTKASLTDAWHPFCISRRIPVWISLWSADLPSESAHQTILNSLANQAEFLARYPERDVGGNHLLENIRALVLASLFLDLPRSESWVQTGTRLLRREIARQILPYGEHFERSPYYHLEMLDAFLDLTDALQQLGSSLSPECRNIVSRMQDFLAAVLHPDGNLPLFADSVLPDPERIQHLLGDKKPTTTPPAATVEGQYWIFREQDHQLIFDGGPVGADHLPAHAHCDLTNFEISLGGQRFIVDSGVYDYADSEMRAYCRSSAAHNVLEIDGVSQCDVWSKFRMGYRGHPVKFETGAHDDFEWVIHGHDAYRRLNVPLVQRLIASRVGGPWIILDRATGHGLHEFKNRLHLHPDVQAQQLTSQSLQTTRSHAVVSAFALGNVEIAIEQGWYCPEFGVKHTNQVVVAAAQSDAPFWTGWFLSWNVVDRAPELQINGETATVRWQQNGTQESWSITLSE